MSKLPLRLKHPPILEAVAEIRFAPVENKSAEMLLPGYLHAKLKNDYPKIEATDLQRMWPAVRNANADFSYLALTRLIGEHRAISIGAQVLGIAFLAPYPGWNIFWQSIKQVLFTAKESGALGTVERISIKYVNFLSQAEQNGQLRQTKVSLKVGDREVDSELTHVRCEFNDGDLIKVVQIVTQASSPADASQPGVVVDVDVISNGPFSDFWDTAEEKFTKIHDAEKEQFFSLLTDETLNRYEPEY
jgi:uncharacterized protein (TIGR04255 family)